MQLTVDSGQLPVEWEVKKLCDICEIYRGGSPRPIKDFLTNEANGINWIKISDASVSSKYIYETKEKIKPDGVKYSRLVNEGDFILSNSMSFGRPYIMRTSGCIHDGWLVLKDKSGLFDQDYLYYFLGSNTTYKQFDILAAGSTVRNLNIDLVKGVKVTLPPLPEQKRIVAILDEAFEGIDRAISNTEKNLSNARELFESYLNSIFSQKGEGWEEKKLEDVCSITSKLIDPRQPEFIDLPHIGAGNMISMTGELIEVKTARQEQLISGKFLFDETMVLYSKIRPYLMKACRPDFSGLCSADVYPLLPNNEQLNKDFLFYILMSRDFTNYAISGSDRAGMPKVNRDHLFRYSTWIPSISDQINIAQKIYELATETQNLETIYRQKIAALKELKQSILQKAFTGELTADKSITAMEETAA
ncbi:restriction endonuclease subunit S [Dolichospermum flos-aquae]|uniref:Restriction endonuclease subunit S n=1 Tax=Dolichospermum flos-aquae LEGE 04289 TaxID=1828708 RepID=A0ACC5Q796_DOLFA|nr:restriction endonuclease subunit S [Dolichospermum flos-aquae]MBE9220627.1 restriction endonuclease subunit S [Dolichospermum flos-aquae LEGE 04289]